MQNVLTAIVVAFNFFPGYKTASGALTLMAVAMATAFNAFAPQIGLPAFPAEWLEVATVTGNALLGVGVANKLVKA